MTLIDLDSYYIDQSHISYSNRIKLNFDDPKLIDIDLFLNHLERLRNGYSIEKPVYNYKDHLRSTDIEIINSKKYIIIDGIHCLTFKKLRQSCDIKIYLDIDPDVCFIRRLKRDMEERGRTLESVIKQYLETVRPMQKKYIIPAKKYADYVLYERNFINNGKVNNIYFEIMRYAENK